MFSHLGWRWCRSRSIVCNVLIDENRRFLEGRRVLKYAEFGNICFLKNLCIVLVMPQTLAKAHTLARPMNWALMDAADFAIPTGSWKIPVNFLRRDLPGGMVDLTVLCIYIKCSRLRLARVHLLDSFEDWLLVGFRSSFFQGSGLVWRQAGCIDSRTVCHDSACWLWKCSEDCGKTRDHLKLGIDSSMGSYGNFVTLSSFRWESWDHKVRFSPGSGGASATWV